MQMTDSVADFLTRIRNACLAKQDVIAMPASTFKIGLAHILKEEGFIRNYKCVRDGKQGVLKLALKFSDEGVPAIRGLKRVSTSSRRVYVTQDEVPVVRNGFGISIISTSKGLLTGSRAREMNVGGEHVCSIY